MKQASQKSSLDASARTYTVHKRGRPRKNAVSEGQASNCGKAAEAPKVQKQNSGGNDCALPAHARLQRRRNQPPQLDHADDVGDCKIGQAVSGVIDAAFDAGYLLTVRVGNSRTTLRGVVFMEGSCVPVSAENNVAPDVLMIERAQVPIPKRRRQTHVVKSRACNVGPRQVATASAETGCVIGERVHLSAKKAARIAAKCRQVLGGKTTPVNELMLVDQMKTGGRGIHQSSNEDGAWLSVLRNIPFCYNRPLEEQWRAVEGKSLTSPGEPSERMLREGKKVLGDSQLVDDETDHMESEGIGAMAEPPYVKPLQAVQPEPNVASCPAVGPLECNGGGRMTQLLQAVEDAAQQRCQLGKAQEPDSGHKCEE